MILLTAPFFVPPLWLVFPFALLLLLIATGPLFFAHFWHHHYQKVALALGVIVAVYYIIVRHDGLLVAETLAEYISFISLLAALFIASGGVYIFADIESRPIANIIFLCLGALLTNLIGTTGASVLLIRPFMRLNRYRLKPYHIVFFIFYVSNLGGLLTPIGDPPLFMGFLKGVPFFWTLSHLWLEWIFALSLLSVVLYFFEKQNKQLDDVDVSTHYTNKVIIEGKRNFIWLALIIGFVFLDPNSIPSLPHIEIHGKKVSFIREILFMLVSIGCYQWANKKALQNNNFDFEPIKEVAYLFIGIFLTMIPALQILSALGNAEGFYFTETMAYWGSGIFSSVLDNAPTYVNFFTLTLTFFGFDPSNVESVRAFLATPDAHYIMAVSTGSVFFGAMTYIGNGPNFMVKSIAEQNGVKMPTFFEYIIKYSIPILLPILFITWLIFYL